MKIEEFQYENKSIGLKINPIKFNPDLTLLVGASGVGKTLILLAIGDLINFAKGPEGAAKPTTAKWDIKFSSDKEHEYSWNGTFEPIDFKTKKIKNRFEPVSLTKPEIIQEKLLLNNEMLVKRDVNIFKYDKKEVFPKRSSYESAINLFAQELNIKPAYNGLKQIIGFNYTHINLFIPIEPINLTRYKTLDEIRNSEISTLMKLYCVSNNLSDTFDLIKEDFISIFPQISDLRFTVVPSLNDVNNKYHYILQIKERTVRKWINQNLISMGMFKTLLLISELYLCKDENIIIIDEFENSLGINCMDSAVENILNVDRNLQFIITSHHPYIINNIDMSHWKVVSRKGGVISTKNANDYGLDKYDSHHEAFLKLIQLSDYSKGINV